MQAFASVYTEKISQADSFSKGLSQTGFRSPSLEPLKDTECTPPQSLSGHSKTGTPPSRSAFMSDFNHLGRELDDESRLGG
jgi:hypothetical protein